MRLAAFLLGAFLAGPALAECQGTDRLAVLEAEAPGTAALIAARAADAPFGEGRFWRVEKDGAVSHVFGTYHDPGARVATLPPAVEAAIAGSRLLLLEITEADQAVIGTLTSTEPQLFFITDGARPVDALRADEQAALGEIVAEYGLTLDLAAQMRPWFLAVLLGQPACTFDLLQQGAPVLDRVVEQRAEAAGLTVDGLEGPRTAIKMMAALAAGEELNILRATLATAQFGADYRETAVSLYLDERIAEIWEYSKYEAERDGAEADEIFDAFERTLLVERNRDWMPRILKETARGGAFIAVGALHLPYDDGILALLAAEGYEVTRLTP